MAYKHHFGMHLVLAVILFGVSHFITGGSALLGVFNAVSDTTDALFVATGGGATSIGIGGAQNIIAFLGTAILNFIIYYGAATILLFFMPFSKKEDVKKG